MKTIQYNPTLTITNLDHLPRGTGAKYLEVVVGHNESFIAVAWRRVKPKTLEATRALIQFKK